MLSRCRLVERNKTWWPEWPAANEETPTAATYHRFCATIVRGSKALYARTMAFQTLFGTGRPRAVRLKSVEAASDLRSNRSVRRSAVRPEISPTIALYHIRTERWSQEL